MVWRQTQSGEVRVSMVAAAAADDDGSGMNFRSVFCCCGFFSGSSVCDG